MLLEDLLAVQLRSATERYPGSQDRLRIKKRENLYPQQKRVLHQQKRREINIVKGETWQPLGPLLEVKLLVGFM